jgi:hypothetical protein
MTNISVAEGAAAVIASGLWPRGNPAKARENWIAALRSQ